MKKIIDLLQAKDYETAKKVAKERKINRSIVHENQLLNMIKHCSLISPEAEVIRILSYRKLFCHDYSQEVEVIEQFAITMHNWEQVQSLIREYPLSFNALFLFICKVYHNVNNKRAMETFFLYDELYDFNKVKWPEVYKEMCQEIVAQIAIKHSVNK